MEMVIQSDKLYAPDRNVTVQGSAPLHGCGLEMQLVVQEAPSSEYGVQMWWYCSKCSETQLLRILNGQEVF